MTKKDLKVNPGKDLVRKANGISYNRYPVRTKLVEKTDKLVDIVEEFVSPHWEDGDIIVFSERMVAITQGRLIHESEIKAGFWAKLLVHGVKKWEDDPGFRIPKKMQVAIDEAGLARVLFAATISALTKPFGIRGLYYKIVGNQVSEIDGFAPGTIPPYDQYAVLGPKDPSKECEKLIKAFPNSGVSFVIVDSNNIDTEILGNSNNLPISKDTIKEIILDNPIGQGTEQTPICIVSKA